jgi:hypothetical protein
METWKECGCGKCGKRFEPARRTNQHRRGGKPHAGATYCSRACQQKAYLWRLQASQKPVVTVPGVIVAATVTSPLQHIESIEELTTKIEHPRPAFGSPWKSEGGNYLLFDADRLLATVKPDKDWPGLWRVHLPNGHVTDMVNLTRAKDAALSLAA